MIGTIIIYGTSFGLSILLCNLYQNKKSIKDNKKLYKIFPFICIFPVVVIATVRYGVGTDYFTYVDIYSDVASRFSISLIFNYYQEPMNIIMYYLSSVLFGGSTGMFFLFSFITSYFIFKGIENFKSTLSMPFAFFIFFMTYYLISYNAMRQMVAVSIIFYAYKYIMQRNLKSYLLFIIIAMLFHSTSFIAVSFYFIFPTEKNKEASKIKSIIFYIFILISPFIMEILTLIIFYIIEKYGIYNKYANLINRQANVYYLLYIIPILLFILFFRNKLLKINYKYEILIKMMFLQIPLQFIGNYIAFADRLSLYVSISQVVLIPIILFNIRNKEDKIIATTLMIIWYIFYHAFMFIVLGSNGVYPYQSIIK